MSFCVERWLGFCLSLFLSFSLSPIISPKPRLLQPPMALKYLCWEVNFTLFLSLSLPSVLFISTLRPGTIFGEKISNRDEFFAVPFLRSKKIFSFLNQYFCLYFRNIFLHYTYMKRCSFLEVKPSFFNASVLTTPQLPITAP